MNKLKTWINKGKGWCERHRGLLIAAIYGLTDFIIFSVETIAKLLYKAIRWATRVWCFFCRGVSKLMVMGIVINVAAYFYPELPGRIPTIYTVCNGCIEAVEFAVKTVVYALCTLPNGNWEAFTNGIDSQLSGMMNQLASWLISLHF